MRKVLYVHIINWWYSVERILKKKTWNKIQLIKYAQSDSKTNLIKYLRYDIMVYIKSNTCINLYMIYSFCYFTSDKLCSGTHTDIWNRLVRGFSLSVFQIDSAAGWVPTSWSHLNTGSINFHCSRWRCQKFRKEITKWIILYNHVLCFSYSTTKHFYSRVGCNNK